MQPEHTTNPTAAILIIGAEVLSGKIQDANSPFLATRLREEGIDLLEIRTVTDCIEAISSAAKSLRQQVDYVFTTGGIGPTHDDVTVVAIAHALGRPVIRHTEMENRIRDHFGSHVTPAALTMADVVEGTTLTMGDNALVPTMQVENITILPGIPDLMRQCFEAIAPRLGGSPFYTKSMTLKASESSIAEKLAAIQENFAGVSIGSYPRFDNEGWHITITVDGRSEQVVQEAMSCINTTIAPDKASRTKHS